MEREPQRSSPLPAPLKSLSRRVGFFFFPSPTKRKRRVKRAFSFLPLSFLCYETKTFFPRSPLPLSLSVGGVRCGILCGGEKRQAKIYSFPNFRLQFRKMDGGGLVQSYVATNKPPPKLSSGFRGHDIHLRSFRPFFPRAPKRKGGK